MKGAFYAFSCSTRQKEKEAGPHPNTVWYEVGRRSLHDSSPNLASARSAYRTYIFGIYTFLDTGALINKLS